MQSAACILLALLLIAAVIRVYRGGLTAREEDPLAWIFSREIVAQAFRPLAPLFFAGIVLTAAGLILSIRDENSLMSVKVGKVEYRAPSGKVKILQMALLIAALVLIVAGIFNGSARDVFAKAVKICTECVGLG